MSKPTDLIGMRVHSRWNENYGGTVRAVATAVDTQNQLYFVLLVEDIQGLLFTCDAHGMRVVKEEASEGPA